MWEFYKHGGLGMIPTTLFGVLLVASALLFMIRPGREKMQHVVALGVTTIVCGFLGFSVGLIMTFRFIYQLDPNQQFAVAAMGVAESLNNIVLSLLIVLVAAVATSIGTFRLKKRT